MRPHFACNVNPKKLGYTIKKALELGKEMLGGECFVQSINGDVAIIMLKD